MRRVDVTTGLLVAVIGGYALFIAFDLTLTGDDGVPGPGLFPALLSGTLVVLGLGLLATAVVSLRRRGSDTASPFGRDATQRAGKVSAGFVAGVVALPFLGFLATGVLLVGYLTIGFEKRRLVPAVAASLLIPGIAYVLFAVLLGVRLPEGIFGQD